MKTAEKIFPADLVETLKAGTVRKDWMDAQKPL